MIQPGKAQFYLDPAFPFRLSAESADIGSSSALYRIVLLLKGPLFAVSNQEKRIIEAGSFVFLPPFPPGAEPEQIKGAYRLKGSRSLSAESMIFGRHFLDQMLLSCWKNRQLQDFISECWESTAEPKIWPVKSTEMYRQYLSRISAEISERPIACETSVLQYVLRMIILLFRETRTAAEEQFTSAWQISDALKYIHDNYSESFSLDEIAEKYSFSPGYFSRIFREKTGLPLFEYINHIRIQKACILLKRTDQPIIEIAFAVGYNNISFFNRYFRKIIRMSPREYRNSIKR